MTILPNEQLAAAVDDAFESLKPPGILFAVTKAGRVVSQFGRGDSSVGSGEVPNGDMRFPIGSLTKSFGAAAILILREEGKLRLDQSAGELVPELNAFWRRPTLFHLLSMQSGFGADYGGSWGERHLPLSNDEMTERLRAPVIPAAEPGTRYHYSNFGYMVLGRVISVVSGMDARDFILKRLVEPLGMTSTGWVVPEQGRMSGYRKEGDGFAEEDLFSAANDGAVFGGLWSTASDMAKWVGFFADAHPEEGSTFDAVLSRASRDEMQKSVVLRPITPPDKSEEAPNYLGYGLGLASLGLRTEWTIGHGGAVPGFGCQMRWSPSTGLGVFAVANLRYADLTGGCRKILEAIAEVFPKREAVIQPIVARRASAILELVECWDEDKARKQFASNFFIDYPMSSIVERFAALRGVFGDELPGARVVQEDGLSGTIRLGGRNALTFTVSSHEPGAIQEVEFEEAVTSATDAEPHGS